MTKAKIFEMLTALSTGAVILGGCGGAQEPVKATEVPAAAPEASPAAAPGAAASTLPLAKDMPKGNHTQKVRDSARTKPCEGRCGEGTCGPCDN